MKKTFVLTLIGTIGAISLAACIAPATDNLPALDAKESILRQADAVEDVEAIEEIVPLVSEYETDVLVDTDWVLENLDNESVVLLDTSSGEDVYQNGHLPGAVFLAWNRDLTNPDDSTNGQIATAKQLAEALGRVGIGNDDTIVVYDDTSNLFSTRAFWVLKYYQHADVRLYNGGSIKWLEDGQDLTDAAVEIEPAAYTPGEADPAIRTTGEYVLANLDNEEVVACDTRSEAEYTGADARAERGGRIPGAVHLEWNQAGQTDGTFLPASELSVLFVGAGFTPDKEILTYCQTGVRGAHTWFVLSELLGYPNVRNYDGSWAEWGNNADYPIEQ